MTTWTVTQDGAQIGALKLADNDAASIAQWAVTQAAPVLVTPAIPGSVAVNAIFGAQGKVITPAIPYHPDTPAVYRAPTPTEAMASLVQKFFDGLVQSTTQHLKAQASQAASDAVTPITPA